MELGELYVKIGADVKELDRRLAQATRRLDEFAERTERIGQRLSVAITAPLSAAMGMAIKLASDAEETANKFNVSFGSMADEVRTFAHTMASEMGRSKTQMEGFMAQLQSILKPLTGNAEAAAEMSKTLSVLAVDLGSFMNMADAEVLQRLQAGLLGSTEAVDQLGINLRESELQLEAHRQGIEGDVSQLDEATKVYLRFQTILRQTTDAQGDAIRTSDSFANQLKALQAETHDLAVTIGQMLIPEALDLVRTARDAVDWFRRLNPETQETILKVSLLAMAVGPAALAISNMAKAVKVLYDATRLLARAQIVETIVGLISKIDPKVALGVGAAALGLEQATGFLSKTMKMLGDAVTEGLDRLLGGIPGLDTGEAAGLEEAVAGLFTGTAQDALDASEAAKKIYEQASANVAGSIEDGASTIVDEAEAATKALEQELNQTNRVLAKLIAKQFPSGTAWTDPGAFLRAMGLPVGEDMEAVISERQEIIQALQQFAASMTDVQLDRQLGLITGVFADPLAELERQLNAHIDLFKVIAQVIPPTSPLYVALKEQIQALSGEFQRVTKTMDESKKALEADAQAAKEAVDRFDTYKEAKDRALLAILGIGDVAISRAMAEAMGEPADLAEAQAQMQEAQRLVSTLQQLGVGAADGDMTGAFAWIAELQQRINKLTVEDKLRAIREELARTLGMASGQTAFLGGMNRLDIQKRLAAATGEEFDALGFQIDALRKSIVDQLETVIQASNGDLGSFEKTFEELVGADLQKLTDLIATQRVEAATAIRDAWLQSMSDAPEQFVGGKFWLGSSEEAFGRAIEDAMGTDQLGIVRRQIQDTVSALNAMQAAKVPINDSWVQQMLQKLKELNAEAARLTLDQRLADINRELQQAIGPRIEIEHLLASVTGEEFDPAQAKMQAFQRAIWDTAAALLAQGKNMEEVNKQLQPLIDGYTEAAAAVKPAVSAIEQIRAELDKTLTDRLTIEKMLASATGQEFDERAFRAEALQQAIDQIVAEMLRTGAGFEAIWTEVSPLVQQLRALRQETERDPFKDIQEQFQERLKRELDPATNILAGLFEALAPTIEALQEPLKIIGQVVGTVLAPVLKAFAPILRFVADVFIQVAIVIGQVWNALVSIIDAIPFVDMSGWYIDIDALRQAQRDLYDETNDTTDAVREFGESLRNVPHGFKVALERFQAASPAYSMSTQELGEMGQGWLDLIGGWISRSGLSISSLANGGVVARPTVATMGDAGVVAAAGVGGQAGRPEIHNHYHIEGDVYGWDDFKRKVAQADSENKRGRSLAARGLAGARA